MEDPQPVIEQPIERAEIIETKQTYPEKHEIESLSTDESEKTVINEKQPTQSDSLPKSSHKKDEIVEDLKPPTPDQPSPITNINQKLQDAMSSFFNKFKKP